MLTPNRQPKATAADRQPSRFGPVSHRRWVTVVTATAAAVAVWAMCIAAAVLAVSLLGPLSATTTAAVGVLVGLHLLVGAILLIALPGPSTATGGAA